MNKTRILTLILFLFSKVLFAQSPYVGEIRLFAGNFAPNGWMFCNGALLPISEYETLFQLIGTTYGGDGQSTFAIPDLQGRVPIGQGQGPGLSNRILGEKGGQETVTLTTLNMPSHSHLGQITVNNAAAKTNVPVASSSLAPSGFNSGRTFVPNWSFTTAAPDLLYDTVVTENAGNSEPVSIVKPNCALNYIISLFGIYPSPN
jgi:microcystin-dependent protein